MVAQKEEGILSRGEGWEHGKAVTESGNCDYNNDYPSEGPEQFKDRVKGRRVTAVADGLNLKHISHLNMNCLCEYGGLQ